MNSTLQDRMNSEEESIEFSKAPIFTRQMAEKLNYLRASVEMDGDTVVIKIKKENLEHNPL
jgi:hypothetical protein